MTNRIEVHQPEMFGERIWLRPIELRDALALSQSTSDYESGEFLESRVPVSETAFRAWIQDLPESELVWAICREEQQEAIGTASIRKIDLGNRTAETGMGFFYEEDRGKGLGQEVKALQLDFAFGVMGLNTLTCTIDSRNVRSQRSVERPGFTLAGKLTANVPMGLGKYADTLIYQIMESDWRDLD